MARKGELNSREKEQLTRLKQTLADIRYVIRQYKTTLPEDAWVAVGKLANDPKLILKNISTTSSK